MAIRNRPEPFALGALGAALYGGMTVASATVIGSVTDRVVIPAFEASVVDSGLLVVGVALVLGVAILKAAGVFWRRYGAHLMQQGLQAHYRRQVTRQYLELPIAWHRRHSTGQLLSNANADVESAFFTIAPLPMSIGVLVMLVATAALLVVTDPFLTAIGFVVWPILAFVNWKYQHSMQAVATEAQQLRADVSGVAHESIDAALVIKTLGREGAETERFRGWSDGLRDKMIELGRIRGYFDPIIEGLPNLGIMLVLAVGAWRVQTSGLTTGDLVEFAYLFGLLGLPMRVFGWMLGELPRSVVGWERVEQVLRAEAEQRFGTASGDGRAGADVGLEQVVFTHPDSGHTPGHRAHAHDQASERGLTGVSFDVEAGTTIAIVGPTGSGKSTIAALLVRLFDPDAGGLLFDGTDLRDLARSELSDHIAVVFQEPFLFDDTVGDNITLGGGFSDEQVREAAALAQADGFIEQLEAGYATRVGERGATLSGGQRQRIALARGLIRRPRLLVLDDATSAVDPAVEERILRGLKDAELPFTVIVVAYRRSTIAMADQVVFVENGQVSAQGPHQELHDTVRSYRELVTAYDRRQAV
ncbi:MAG TPA: ABC transporter ATP-binding protein [Nitriliruptorales bacterium]